MRPKTRREGKYWSRENIKVELTIASKKQNKLISTDSVKRIEKKKGMANKSTQYPRNIEIDTDIEVNLSILLKDKKMKNLLQHYITVKSKRQAKSIKKKDTEKR